MDWYIMFVLIPFSFISVKLLFLIDFCKLALLNISVD